MRLIDADVLIQAVRDEIYWTESLKSAIASKIRAQMTVELDFAKWREQARSYEQTIAKLTAAIAEREERTGEWKAVHHWRIEYQCSLCGGIGDTTMRYCPDCGAKMEEEHEPKETRKGSAEISGRE